MWKRFTAMFVVVFIAMLLPWTAAHAVTVTPAYSQYSVHHVCGSTESVPYGYRHWYRGHWQGYWFAICGGQYPNPQYGPQADAGWAWWGGGQTPIRTRSRLFVESYCSHSNTYAYSQVDWYASDAKKHYGKHLYHNDTVGYRHFWSFSVPIYSSAGLWRKIHMVKAPLVAKGWHCHDHHSFIYVTLMQDPPANTKKGN